jgi:hypothetical protein
MQDPLALDPIAAYDFRKGQGDTIASLAPDEDDSLTLTLGDAIDREARPPRQGILGPVAPPGQGGARWSQEGLVIEGGRVAAKTYGPAAWLTETLVDAGALSMEFVGSPRDTEQNGPARMVSLSVDPYNRNLTLGQEADRYVLRLRTTDTDANGTPNIETPPGTVRPELQHVMATYDGGVARVYVDGELAVEEDRDGSLESWNGDYPLVIANEADLERQWRGTVALASIYDRAFTNDEVTGRADAWLA